MPHRYSVESLHSREGRPGTSRLACSSQVGWSSLLVRSCRSIGASDTYETMATPDQTIVVVLKGEVEIEVHENGRSRRGLYRTGSVGLTAGHRADRMTWRVQHGSGSFDKLHVFLPQTLIKDYAEHFRRPGQASADALSVTVFNDVAIASMAEPLLRAVRSGAPDIYAEAAAQWLTAHLFSSRPDLGGSEDARRAGHVTDARLRRALDFIADNLGGAVNLEAIAAEAGISKFHFNRLFREKLGETPVSYLFNQRLDKAAGLLRSSDSPVGQVAFECGFPNVAHFAQRFRRRYGRSPSAYRSEVSGLSYSGRHGR